MTLLNVQPAFKLQLTHLLLSAGWNIAGIILISLGMQALGPTASWDVVALLAIFAMLLIYARRHSRWFYVITTTIIVCAALFAIVPAFTQDPSLWPSNFWRYSGVLLNSLGLFSGLWAIAKLMRAP